jgi:hypothetical protein
MVFLVPGLPIPYARALPVTSLTSVQSFATIFHPGSSSRLVNLLSVSTFSVPVPSVSVDSTFIAPNRNSRKVDLKIYLDRSHLNETETEAYEDFLFDRLVRYEEDASVIV